MKKVKRFIANLIISTSPLLLLIVIGNIVEGLAQFIESIL